MQFVEFFWKYVFFGILESVTLLFLFLYLTDNLSFFQTHWKSCLLYIILYLVLAYFSLYYQEIQFTVLYLVYSVLLLAYITNTNLYFSLTVNILSFLIYGITEIAVTLPVLHLMGMSLDTVRQNISLMRNALFIIRPIQMVIIYLITRLPIKRELHQNRSNRGERSSVNYLLLTIFFMSVFFISIAKYVENTAVLITSGLLFFSTVQLGIMEIKERIKLIDIKGQFKLQEEYARNMELIVDAVRKEKHDYKNHISTLVALCTIHDTESIDKIRSYALKLTSNEYQGRLHFYDTGNKYLMDY